MEEIKEKNQKEIVYLDESGINDNETNPHAWGKKGMRIYGVKNAERKRRIPIHDGNEVELISHLFTI